MITNHCQVFHSLSSWSWLILEYLWNRPNTCNSKEIAGVIKGTLNSYTMFINGNNGLFLMLWVVLQGNILIPLNSNKIKNC